MDRKHPGEWVSCYLCGGFGCKACNLDSLPLEIEFGYGEVMDSHGVFEAKASSLTTLDISVAIDRIKRIDNYPSPNPATLGVFVDGKHFGERALETMMVDEIMGERLEWLEKLTPNEFKEMYECLPVLFEGIKHPGGHRKPKKGGKKGK